MKNNIYLKLLIMVTILSLLSPAVFGDVVINEIMKDPNAVTDTNGEYFELYNDDPLNSVNMNGWIISDSGTDTHTISGVGVISIEPLGFFVLCRDDDSTTNGEITCDYEYLGFTLTNADDEVILVDDAGTEVDRVEYDDVNFPDTTGASLELIDPSLDNSNGLNWREATEVFGAGDRGTPGAANTGNTAPSFTSTPVTTVNEDNTYIYTITAADAEGDTFNFAATTLPTWLSFNAGTATLTGTPTNAEVGNHTVVITVTDQFSAASTQSFTITVINTNDAPVAADDSTTTPEDTIVTLDVLANDNDADSGDSLSIQSVTAPLRGNAVISNSNRINYTPVLNYNGEDTFSYTITDEEGATDTATVTVIVTAVNDRPTVTPISNQEATEGVEFNLEINAADIENAVGDLYVLGSSLPAWLRVDSDNRLRIVGTPDRDDIGINALELLVSDGTDNSESAEFNITVQPALEINRDSIAIEIGEQTLDIDDTLTVSPGDEVMVRFAFTNNLIDRVLGHVAASARVTVGNDFVDYEGVCSGVDCDNGEWVLRPGDTAEDGFDFMVPSGITANQFTIILNVEYDRFWDFLFGDDFENSIDFNFTVERETASAEITAVEVQDPTLNCTRTAVVDLTLVNTGVNTVTPEVLVYAQSQSRNFDPITGEFPAVELAQVELNPLAPATEETLPINIDVSTFAPGLRNLFIYLVNPYFDRDGSFIGDSVQTEVTIGNCLDTTELEQELALSKNTLSETSADLRDFLREEEDSGYSFDVSVTAQSNSDLIDCQMVGTSQLTCAAPRPGAVGENDVTLSIAEADAISDPITETFTVSITPTLEVVSLRINNANVQEAAATAPLRPADAITADVTVRNTLDRVVTGINANITLNGVEFSSSTNEISIPAGQTRTVSLTGTIPLTLATGEYDAELTIQGRDFNDNTLIQGDIFEFMLAVQQNPADVEITSATLENTALTCSDSTTLSVQLTNRGSNDENDVVVTVTGGDVELSSAELTLERNEQLDLPFTIMTEDLSLGNNVLTIRASYRDNFAQDTETVTIRRNTCLAQESITPDDTTLVVRDEERIDFEVGLNENGFDSTVSWTTENENGETIDSGSGLEYTFIQTEAGEYTITATVNANEEESHSWTVLVSDVPVSQNFNLPTFNQDDDLTNFPNFELENVEGRIAFTTGVDLSDLLDIDEIATITDTSAAINSQDSPGLAGRTATITLFRTFQNPWIQRSEGFNSGTFTTCTACQLQRNAEGEFVFTVSGFSTYRVLEAQPAGLTISTIAMDNVRTGQAANATITVTNTGTNLAINSFTAVLEGVNARYQARIVGTLPATLAAGESTTALRLELTVPTDETSGAHNIGNLVVRGLDAAGNPVSTTQAISLNPQSFLTIESVKLNGKAAGDLTLEEANEFDVKVKNTYSQDINDITVTVTILDVDGDDIEKESESFDLGDGKDDTITVSFDLSGENVDESQYTVRIEVEGEGEDRTQHRTVLTGPADVERENHKIIVQKATLGSSTLQCSRQTSLQVIVENIGENDEDDVEIKVKNIPLGIDLSKSDLELDKFSGSDNEYRTTFNLNFEDAASGSHTLSVEVYRDGSVDDTEEVPVQISTCSTTSTTTGQNQVQADADRELAAELQRQLQARQQEVQPVISSSFRDSDKYMLLLGILVALMFITIVMAIVVLVKKR